MFSTLFHNHQGLLLLCLCRPLLVFHFSFAHGCDHAQIFCAHGLIHAHRKSRVIGVRMAMCTSKPIIGKDAAWWAGGRPRPQPSQCGQSLWDGGGEEGEAVRLEYFAPGNNSERVLDQEEVLTICSKFIYSSLYIKNHSHSFSQHFTMSLPWSTFHITSFVTIVRPDLLYFLSSSSFDNDYHHCHKQDSNLCLPSHWLWRILNR